jgi:hypothetical protein
MNDRVRPDEAARALAEIGQRQEQVIKLTAIPRWFWWAVGVLTVGFSAAIESKRPVAIAIGTVVFALGIAATTSYVAIGGWRRAQVRNNLLGPGGALAIVSFVAVTVGVSLAVAFGSQAAGFDYPGTLGSTVGAVLMAIGGPLLTRHLHSVMLANRAGGQR